MANGKKYDNSTLRWLSDYLKKEMPSSQEQAAYNVFGGHRNVASVNPTDTGVELGLYDYKDYLRDGVDPEVDTLYRESFKPEYMKAFDDEIAAQDALRDTSQGVSLGQLSKMLLGAARQHPYKTMGLAALGAGNVGGLIDNNKFGGQLGGLALGGLGSYMAHANPGMAAMLTLGGGELGALFDKLRAKRESQRQQMPQPVRR